MVILSHCWSLNLGSDRTEPLGRWSNGQVTMGFAAVLAFFSISGYLVSASLLRSASTRTFLMKRILRIYPGFALATVVGFFCVAPMVGLSINWLLRWPNLVRLLFNVIFLQPLGLPGAFAGNPVPGVILGSLWSIIYEFVCYLVLPAVGMFGLFSRRRRWLLLTLLATDIALESMHLSVPGGNGLPLIRIAPAMFFQVAAYFLSGAIFFAFGDLVRWNPALAVACAAAAFLSLLNATLFMIVGPLTVTYFFLWLGFTSLIRLHRFGEYGDFSYGTYANAYPIQQLLVRWIGPGKVGPLPLFLMAWPMSVGAGILSWFSIERRFIQVKRKSERAAWQKPELIQSTPAVSTP